MKPRVLCLITNGFEEIETVTPVDLLRRLGAEVTIVALHPPKQVIGRSGIRMEAEAVLEEIDPEEFEVLLLPGGPGYKEMREDGRPARLARRFAEQGKWIAAICAAPAILWDAGILQGRSFTAHAAVREELRGAVEAEVVEDGKILTSRGPGTALRFALVLGEKLFGAEAVLQLRKEIMLDPAD